MRRVLIGLLVVSVFLAGQINLQAQKGLKIGVVDVAVILKELPEAVEADKKFTELNKKYQDTLLQKQKILEAKFEQYQKQKAMMPADQQQKEEAELNQLNMEWQQYRELIFGQNGILLQQKDNFLEPIREKIFAAIEKVAKEENMSFVFAQEKALLYYFEEKFDITYRVLDMIKRGGK